MILFLAAVLLVQDKPASSSSSLPEEAKTALEKVLKALDSSEIPDRESARRDLRRLSDAYGEPLLHLAQERARQSSSEVKSSVEDLVKFRARVAEARKTVAAFDVLGTPDLKGKKFVVYNNGGWSHSASGFNWSYTYGWLLEEAADSIHLADESPTCGKIERSRELPKDWERFKDSHPKDAPLPGEYKEVDFERFCKDLLGFGKGPSAHPYATREASGLMGEAVYAYWAFKRGLDDLGLELVAQTEGTFAGPHNDWVKSKKSVSQLIEAFLVQHLRAAALGAAHGGEAPTLVLERWKTIATRLPEQEYPGEAKEMCALYETLVQEEAAWVEPKPEELARWTVPKKVDYWIHELRNVAASQWSDPGSVDIMHRWDRSNREKAYPPDELVKLGWDALPALVEHLEDRLPSRSIGWHRSFSPGSYYLLRVGDCCEQVFSAISGVSIYQPRSTSGAMVKDGDAPASKAKALKWWTETGKGGAEKHYLSALDSPEQAGFAAEKLLGLDKAKHLPKLLLLLEKGPREIRNSLLRPMGPFLEPEHAGLLEPVFASTDDQAVCDAAKILWDRFHSDRGAVEVIARLKATDAEDRDSRILFHGPLLLRRIRTEPVARGLADLMKAKNLRVRMHAISTAGEFPSPVLAKALVALFGDQAATGWHGEYDVRYCDAAAEALGRMTGLGEKFRLKGSPEDRDRTIGGLEAWWKREGESLDWAGLVKKLEEAERPKSPPK
jgi:hypothetical protein